MLMNLLSRAWFERGDRMIGAQQDLLQSPYSTQDGKPENWGELVRDQPGQELHDFGLFVLWMMMIIGIFAILVIPPFREFVFTLGEKIFLFIYNFIVSLPENSDPVIFR